MEHQHANKAEKAEQSRGIRDDAARQPQALTPEEVLLQLQQSAGNRAVGRLLQHMRGGDPPKPPPEDGAAGGKAAPGPATLSALERRGEGSPLPSPLLGRAERALGTDLTRVRLHTGADASDAARELEANAFTQGQDIYFGVGKYRPETARGRRLLMHELVHTVQQRPDSSHAPHAPDYTVSNPGEPAEAEAHDISARALKGESFAPPSSAVPARHIMRDYVRVPTVEPDEDERRSDEGDVSDEVEREEEAEGLLTAASPPDFPLELKRLDEAGQGQDAGELVFVVPLDINREGIARRLFNDPQKGRAFDIVPAGELKTGNGRPARAVRVRDLKSLTPEAASRMRDELEQELKEDVRWTIEKLSQRRIDNDDELALLARAVKWSQRSDWKDAAGVQYFDRFLDALSAVALTEHGLFSDTHRSALDWLLVELEEKSLYLYELIGHRSKSHKPISPRTGQPVEATSTMTQWREVPQLAQHNVVGYYEQRHPATTLAKGHVSIAPITVREKLLEETTRDRAEIAARNAPTRQPRVVLPGGDGKFYVFSVNFPYFEEDQQDRYQSADSTKLVSYWWVYPTTVFIRGGEFQSDVPKAAPGDKTQRQDLLKDALEKATTEDPSPLLGLDFDVLSLATLEQRVAILKLVINSKRASETQSFDLLTRLLYTTPGREFPLLERRMSAEGITARMLRLNLGTNLLATFGRIFTQKTLASTPVGADALTNIETLSLGEDADGWYHFAVAEGMTAASKVVPRKEWSPTSAPRVGNEPGTPGEAGGAIDRTTIVFHASKLKLSLTTPTITKTRPLLPTELVRIEVLGSQPQTLIVTALEAAGLLDVKSSDLMKYIVTPLAKVYAMAFTGAGLVRIFGTALAEGLMAGGMRGAVAAVGEQALTKAGTSALLNAALLGSMEAVEHFRGELEKTEAGRAFLATYEIATTILITRDIFHLLSSGIVKPLTKLAVTAGQVVSAGGRAGLLRLQRELEALELAWTRWKAAGEVVGVEAETGAIARLEEKRVKFNQYLMAARAEVAATNTISTLSAAGRDTKVAEEFFKTLQKHATGNVELARAQRAVANHAAGLDPAAAEEYLRRLKSIIDLRPRHVVELGGFLHASTRVSQPIEFLNEVEKLVMRKGLTRQTIGVFGEKALLHTYEAKKGVDLAWLNTLKHSDADLNALGSDPNTSWMPIQSAVKEITGVPPKYNRLPWVRSILRGAATEMVTEAQLRENLIPGMRVKGQQVDMLESKIDFALESGLGRQHGLEVKGYTDDTFREALNTFRDNENVARDLLDADKRGVLRKIDRMLKQLNDARKFTGNNAYLAVTDDLSGPTKQKLEQVVNKYAPGTEIVYLKEAEIKSVSQRLAEGFGVPEVEKMRAQQGKLPKP